MCVIWCGCIYHFFVSLASVLENPTKSLKILVLAPDRYFKIRPVMDKIRQNLLLLEEEGQYAIDEMMIPYKGWKAGNSFHNIWRPRKSENKGRCRYCKEGKIRVYCMKCYVNLFFVVEERNSRNCFRLFHNKWLFFVLINTIFLLNIFLHTHTTIYNSTKYPPVPVREQHFFIEYSATYPVGPIHFLENGRF